VPLIRLLCAHLIVATYGAMQGIFPIKAVAATGRVGHNHARIFKIT
jgi:hypothetical protein